MGFVCVPVIVVFCYLIAEFYKMIVKDEGKFKYVPLLVSVSGGILGLLIYLISPEIILDATNPFYAILIGIVSGASSTGANQLIKQLFGKTDESKTK